jgi:hypothetical protein
VVVVDVLLVDVVELDVVELVEVEVDVEVVDVEVVEDDVVDVEVVDVGEEVVVVVAVVATRSRSMDTSELAHPFWCTSTAIVLLPATSTDGGTENEKYVVSDVSQVVAPVR